MAEKKDIEKRNITVFGAETEFDGVLEFNDELIITGKFTGKINAPEGNLEIAKNSVCEVDSIEVNSLVIAGNVKGKINAKDRVEICSGSTVHSDITTSRFRIANNVDFNGDVKMLDKEPEVDLFSVASAEFKKTMIIHSDVVK